MTVRQQLSFSHYLPIIAIILVTFFIRTLYLQEIALNPDESRIFLGMVDSSIEEITTQYRTDNHVFYSLILHLAALISATPFFLRFVTVTVFGALSISILYQFTNKIFNRSLALLSSTLLALSAYHIHYAQNLRGYALVVFLSILSTSLLYHALRKNMLKLWFLFVVVSVVNIYTYLLAASMMGAHILMTGWFWWSKRRAASFTTVHNALWAFVAITILVGLLYSPIFSQIISFTARERHYESDFRRLSETSLWGVLSDYNTAFNTYIGFEEDPYLGFLFLFLGGVGLLTMLRKQLFQAGWLLIWIAAPYLSATWAFNMIPYVHLSIRFLQFVIPPLLILIAYGSIVIWHYLAKLSSKHFRASWLAQFFRWLPVAGVILLFASVNIRGHIGLIQKLTANDWHNASLYLVDHTSPDDVILCAEYDNSPSYKYVKSDNNCTWNVRIYARAWSKELSTKRAELALGYSTLIKYPGELLRPGRVWLVRWNLPLETPIGYQPAFTSNSYRRVDIIATDEGLPLIDNMHRVAKLQTEFQENAISRAVHWAQLAQIQLLGGDTASAHTSLRLAESYQIDDPDFQTYLDDVRDLVNRPDFIQLKAKYPEHTGLWKFADHINLTGYAYRIEPTANGASLTITLFWQTTDLPSTDYTIFIHTVDENGEKITQKDFRPFGGRYSTQWWRKGDIIWTTASLELSPELPNQDYTLLVGLYNLENMVRLPVLEGDNLDNAVRLFTLDRNSRLGKISE